MKAWPTATLGEIFEITRGGSPRPIDDFITEDPAGINWVMISDATEEAKYITGTKKRIRPEGAQRSRQVSPGDFLLTNSMSFGRPYIMRTSGCIHDGWLALSPRRGNVDADFFYYLLGSKTIYVEFERRAAGATVKNLNIDLVRGVTVPMPPLSEQRRIAAILDKADELRAKRRAALAQLDTLTQSIFLDMFGDPATNPKGWPICTMGDIAEIIVPTRDKPKSFTGDVPWVTLPDITGLFITGAKNLISECEATQVGNRLIQARSVLLSCAATVGRVAIVRRSVYANQQFYGLVPRRDLAVPEYIALCLQAMGERYFRQLGGAFTISFFSKDKALSIPLPVPPLGTQGRLTEIIGEIEALRERHKESFEKFETLFESLQHRVFRGKL